MKICIENSTKKAWVAAVGQTSGGNSKSITLNLNYQNVIELGLPRDYVRKNGVETVDIPDDTRLRQIQATNDRPAILDVDGNELVPAFESKSTMKMYDLVLSEEYQKYLKKYNADKADQKSDGEQ